MVEQEVVDNNGLLMSLPVGNSKNRHQLLVALPPIAGDHFVRTKGTLERCAPL
jgi:hypothetical protein